MSEPAHIANGTVLKADEENRFLLMVAYSPNNIPARGADQFVDVAKAEVLEKACWRFMDNGAKAGLAHKPGGENAARVVENYVYRNPVPWVVKSADGTEQTIRAGDWVVGMILAPETWALYKSGQIGGISPQGSAYRRPASPDLIEKIRSGAA